MLHDNPGMILMQIAIFRAQNDIKQRGIRPYTVNTAIGTLKTAPYHGQKINVSPSYALELRTEHRAIKFDALADAALLNG